MASSTQIIEKKQLTAINRGLGAINEALTLCDLAEGCQIDCAAKREELEMARLTLNKLKSTYFPDER